MIKINGAKDCSGVAGGVAPHADNTNEMMRIIEKECDFINGDECYGVGKAVKVGVVVGMGVGVFGIGVLLGCTVLVKGNAV